MFLSTIVVPILLSLYNVLGSSPQSGQHIGILLVEFGVGLTVSNVMIALFNAFAGFKSGKGN